MKLPNGYGGVVKLTGKRRNPYCARKTMGWKTTEDGKIKQLIVCIGYYPTREKALQALAAYNENPFDIRTNSITFSEVYERWSAEHFEEIVPSAVRTWKSAYNYCKPLYNMRFKDIRVEHLEGTIKNAKIESKFGNGENTKARMKSLFNLMYKWALKHEIADKDYAQLCNSVKKPERTIERIPFTNEEIDLLWENINFPFVDMILINIYSGWRPQELAILKTADVDLEKEIIKGGLKTDAGKNRIVPIHSLIIDLIKNRYNPENEFLFNDENGQQGTSMTYDKYRGRFNKIMKKLNMKHKPHDARHTFITKGKKYNMNEYVLKLIVGHAISDVTEKVYTHRTLQELKEEIEKIIK